MPFTQTFLNLNFLCPCKYHRWIFWQSYIWLVYAFYAKYLVILFCVILKVHKTGLYSVSVYCCLALCQGRGYVICFFTLRVLFSGAPWTPFPVASQVTDVCYPLFQILLIYNSYLYFCTKCNTVRLLFCVFQVQFVHMYIELNFKFRFVQIVDIKWSSVSLFFLPNVCILHDMCTSQVCCEESGVNVVKWLYLWKYNLSWKRLYNLSGTLFTFQNIYCNDFLMIQDTKMTV